MKNIILILILITFSNALFACSCNGHLSFYLHYNTSDKIFKGKVVNAETINDGRSIRILFQVLTKYKGDIHSDTVSVETGLGHGDCGLPVETGDIWIIFSENRQTGICSSNLLLMRGGEEKNIHPWGIVDAKIYLRLLGETDTTKNRYVKEYDSKKQLIAEGLIANGIAAGYWKYYFEPNKEAKDAYEDWPTQQKIFYKTGIKDSIEYEYYKDGKIYSEQTWHNGKENGKEIMYYPDGSIDASRFYIDGKKDGTWEDFYKNGKHYSVEHYSMDKQIKTSTHFYENGDTCWTNSYDDNGNVIKGIMKYESGKLESIDTYRFEGNLRVENSIAYYENGNVKAKYSGYRDEEKKYKEHGEQITYYENGIIKGKKYYDKGKEIGTWEYYDENGVLIKTENKP